MKYLILLILLFCLQMITIFDFQETSDISNWFVVEDRVMGGESTARFFINESGHAQFQGNVSLENNGGFASVRYDMSALKVNESGVISIRLKGDGKNYQFRVKNRDQNEYSYIAEFPTNGDWQEIQIKLNEMYPSFRGRKLNRPNFSHDQIEEITFLIGNKRNEKFQLLIDKIELK